MVEHRSLWPARRTGSVYHIGQPVWSGKINGSCHLAEVHIINKDDMHAFGQTHPLCLLLLQKVMAGNKHLCLAVFQYIP